MIDRPPQTVNAAEFAALMAAQGKRSKFGNRRTTLPQLPGIVFDSAHEARCAADLLLQQQAGLIRNLAFHVPFELVVNGVKIGRYTSDFTFEERGPTVVRTGTRADFFDTVPGWCKVVADAKPAEKRARSRDYILRKKLVKALYAIDIREL